MQQEQPSRRVKTYPTNKSERRAFWESLVEQMQTEDLSYIEMAKRHGVSKSAVASWARRFGKGRGKPRGGKKSAHAKKNVTFVPLLSHGPQAASSSEYGYTITLPRGVKISVPPSAGISEIVALALEFTRALAL